MTVYALSLAHRRVLSQPDPFQHWACSHSKKYTLLYYGISLTGGKYNNNNYRNSRNLIDTPVKMLQRECIFLKDLKKDGIKAFTGED